MMARTNLSFSLMTFVLFAASLFSLSSTPSVPAAEEDSRIVGVSCICYNARASMEDMESRIDRAALDKPDIILLTEGCMHNTPRSATKEERDAKSEPLPEAGPITKFLGRKAKEHNTYIIGSYHTDKVRALKEKYREAVTIETASPEAVYFLSSRHPEKSIHDMMDEFGIETLDKYLDRARKERQKYLPKD